MSNKFRLIFQPRHQTKRQLLQLLSHKLRSAARERERDVRQLHASSKTTSSSSGLISRWWQIHRFTSKKCNLVQISVRDMRLSDHTLSHRLFTSDWELLFYLNTTERCRVDLRPSSVLYRISERDPLYAQNTESTTNTGSQRFSMAR